MFNKFKKGKTMYITTLDRTFDRLFNGLTRDEFFTPNKVYNYTGFESEVLEDGKQKVTINTIGHNPKNISVDVTEEEITIKSKKEEGTSRFVKDIDLTLTVGKDYDGTKTEAKFDNGLLTLLIDKKINKKAKTLKISY
jgi:HSP20 family molecular chaperone IbpA